MGKEPSIRTLRDWTKLRRIPHHRLGHFVYYDPVEVSIYIRTKGPVSASLHRTFWVQLSFCT